MLDADWSEPECIHNGNTIWAGTGQNKNHHNGNNDTGCTAEACWNGFPHSAEQREVVMSDPASKTRLGGNKLQGTQALFTFMSYVILLKETSLLSCDQQLIAFNHKPHYSLNSLCFLIIWSVTADRFYKKWRRVSKPSGKYYTPHPKKNSTAGQWDLINSLGCFFWISLSNLKYTNSLKGRERGRDMKQKVGGTVGQILLPQIHWSNNMTQKVLELELWQH